MTLKVYADVEQGSPEWLELRRGIVTASTVGQLITPKTIKPAENPASRALTAKLVAERITGWVEDEYVSYDMARGHVVEPIARAAYAQWRGVEVVECGFMVQRTDDGWQLGFSPDGLIGDFVRNDSGLVEIKSRNPKDQLAVILAGEVPAEHMAQCQAGLLVTGREWIDYVSFSGGLPLFVKRVEPDRRWNDAIVEAVAAFEAAAVDMQARYESAVVGLPMTERLNLDMEVVI